MNDQVFRTDVALFAYDTFRAWIEDGRLRFNDPRHGLSLSGTKRYLDWLALVSGHYPVKEGTVNVPVEPTREMWAAGGTAQCNSRDKHHDIAVNEIWHAMLAAIDAAISGTER